MNRFLLVLLFVGFAPAVHAQQRQAPAPPDTERALAPPVATDHERPYALDPATGAVTLTPGARTEAEARIRAHREALLAGRTRLPQAERIRQAAPAPTLHRGGATIFTVHSAYDEGDINPGDGVCGNLFSVCTLRAAIEEANATPGVGPIRIEFEFTRGPLPNVGEAWVIPVNYDGGFGAFGSLPTITRANIEIDGETEGSASCGLLPIGTTHSLRVILDGSLTTSGGGLASFASGFTVRGLVIQNFPSGAGLAFSGPNALAECNYIGTDVEGEVAAGNLTGVFVGSTAASAVIRDNLVSGNYDNGLDLFGDFVSVLGNFVGTDDDGNQPLGNGSGLLLSGVGLFITGSDGLIDGNLISANGSTGIDLGAFNAFVGPATRMTLTNNTVGLDRLRGNSGYGNGGYGILLHDGASDNDIGLPGGVNYIADNAFAGIIVIEPDTDNNRIRNNVVGLDLSGNAQPNSYGIFVADGPSGTVIGLGSDGNLAAGNYQDGILLSGLTNTHVEGNIVGLNAAGTARGNGADGIYIYDVANGIIRNNTVSSNSGSGITIAGSSSLTSDDVVIEGNRIGQAPDGTARGNGADGILCLKATDVRIGGTTAGQGNTVAFNGTANPDADGLFLADTCTDVAVLSNSISSNAGLGSDWCPSFPGACDNVTPNDVPDDDGITNYPVLASVENDGTDATITLSLDGLPTQDYRIEFFRNTAPDPSGFGEGQVYITAQPLTTDANGHADLVVTRLAGFFPVGTWVAATATPIDGGTFTGYRSTSEFSAAVEVVDVSGLDYDLTATNTSPLTVAPGGSVSFSYTIDNNTAAVASGQLWYNARTAGGSTVAQAVIVSGSLPGGASTSGSYTQSVPASAPAGTYTYCLRIGSFPGTVVDEECFGLTVTSAPRRDGGVREAPAGAWSVGDVTPWNPTLSEGPDTDSPQASRAVGIPEAFALHAAYPNPFNQSATLRYDLPAASSVRLVVYDALGRAVAVLTDGPGEAGTHTAVFDGAALPSGVYLVRLVTDGQAQTQRLTLLR